MTFAAAMGVLFGHDPYRVAREASSLCEMAAGFALALLIVRRGYLRQSIRVMAVVLWFSAAMIVASSPARLVGDQGELDRPLPEAVSAQRD